MGYWTIMAILSIFMRFHGLPLSEWSRPENHKKSWFWQVSSLEPYVSPVRFSGWGCKTAYLTWMGYWTIMAIFSIFMRFQGLPLSEWSKPENQEKLWFWPFSSLAPHVICIEFLGYGCRSTYLTLMGYWTIMTIFSIFMRFQGLPLSEWSKPENQEKSWFWPFSHWHPM